MMFYFMDNYHADMNNKDTATKMTQLYQKLNYCHRVEFLSIWVVQVRFWSAVSVGEAALSGISVNRSPGASSQQ